MRYEGPIYRPPSEADSLLIQATVGCPHNRCTFCMVYKNGPDYRVRPVVEICEDLDQAKARLGETVQTLFFPAGNTIAMKTDDLAAVCRHAKTVFPCLKRITVYGSSQYVLKKGPSGLKKLQQAGLGRIHVGLESGDDEILKRVKKGAKAKDHIQAGKWAMEAGIELSVYVVLGLGGRERTREHARETARVLNELAPDFTRLRTFVPKINTPLLQDLRSGRFEMLGAHGVLRETQELIQNLTARTRLRSDHYTNYLNLSGEIPQDKERLLKEIKAALERPETDFRPFFIGEQ